MSAAKRQLAEQYVAGNLEAAHIIASDPSKYADVMQEWAAMVLSALCISQAVPRSRERCCTRPQGARPVLRDLLPTLFARVAAKAV